MTNTPSWVKPVEQNKVITETEPKVESLAQRKKREHKAKAAKPGSPAFFHQLGERPNAAADGVLFTDNVVEPQTLAPGWIGWESCGMMGKEKYFRGQAYFDHMIENKKYKDEAAAKKDAEDLFNTGTIFLLAGADGDKLDNTFMRIYGMNEDTFQKAEPPELYKILRRCWLVGEAQAMHKVKKALYKKAVDGDLEAQKTILQQTGDLTPGGNSADDGEGFAIIVDQEDLNA